MLPLYRQYRDGGGDLSPKNESGSQSLEMLPMSKKDYAYNLFDEPNRCLMRGGCLNLCSGGKVAAGEILESGGLTVG